MEQTFGWGRIYICRWCGIKVWKEFKRGDVMDWREVYDWGCRPCFEDRVAAAREEEECAARVRAVSA